MKSKRFYYVYQKFIPAEFHKNYMKRVYLLTKKKKRTAFLSHSKMQQKYIDYILCRFYLPLFWVPQTQSIYVDFCLFIQIFPHQLCCQVFNIIQNYSQFCHLLNFHFKSSSYFSSFFWYFLFQTDPTKSKSDPQTDSSL